MLLLSCSRLTRGFDRPIGFLFGWPHRDINFSFKLMRREVIAAIDLRSEGSLIDAELIVKAKNLGFVIQQLGLDYKKMEIQVAGRTVRNHLNDLCQATVELSIRAFNAIGTSFDRGA